jgi:hypothetical protein
MIHILTRGLTVKICLLMSILFLNLECVLAQEKAVAKFFTDEELFRNSNVINDSGRADYAKPLKYFSAIDPNILDNERKITFYECYGTLLASSGNYDLSTIFLDSAHFYRYNGIYHLRKKDTVFANSLKFADGIKTISKYTRKSRLVFISEEHNRPASRIFTFNLLDSLRKQGFNYIAFEALGLGFNSEDLSLKITSGPYLADASMANLVRHARNLGFKIVQYDCTDSCSRVQSRENVSSRVLSRIIDSVPNIKMVIHCGYSHGSKQSVGNFRTLGKILTDKYNNTLHPISISQHSLASSILPSYSALLYDFLLKKYKFNKAMVVLDSLGNALDLQKDSSFDFIVVNPPFRSETINYFKSIKLRLVTYRMPKLSHGYLLQVYPKAEITDNSSLEVVAPSTTKLIFGMKETKFLIPIGAYVIVIRDINNKVVYNRSLIVKKG